MFFVSGITGHVGGAAARRLLAEGHEVRTVSRNPEKAAEWSRRGVDVRRGDFNDAAAVAGALEGVEGAFIMMPPGMVVEPGYPEAKATVASYTAALRQAPPPRLVALSSFGSEKESGLGLITATHLLEVALAEVPFPTAFVRPGSFIENYLYGVKQAAATGVFDIFLTPTSRPVPMTATVDIGHEVARLLVTGWSGRKVVEIGDRISPDDLARAMGEVLGRAVQARTVDRAGWTAALAHMGVPAGRTGPYEEMMDSVNSGWIDFGAAGAEPVAGTVTPAQVFAQAAKA
jgi:uncharacterized protein YbjT (DUF2867 family)